MIECHSTQNRTEAKICMVQFCGFRVAVWGLLFTALVSGCSHRADPAQELNSALTPFSQTRDQAVDLVATSKHSLGASDLNTLAVSYAALEEKATLTRVSLSRQLPLLHSMPIEMPNTPQTSLRRSKRSTSPSLRSARQARLGLAYKAPGYRLSLIR